MISSTNEARAAQAIDARVTDEELTIDLADGRTISAPLEWFPRLVHGSTRERNHWQLNGHGQGIQWADLDEDISVAGVLVGRPSGESQRSLLRWLESRAAKKGRTATRTRRSRSRKG